jgi:hypothetical protein
MSPGVHILERFLGEEIQSTIVHIFCELLVPQLSIKLGKPGTKASEVFSRQVTHRILDILHSTYFGHLSLSSRIGLLDYHLQRRALVSPGTVPGRQ